MIEKARNQKIEQRVKKLLQQCNVSTETTYTIQEKNNTYQCVIKYQSDGKWKNFWVGTGYKVEHGNLRNAKKVGKEINDIFIDIVEKNKKNQIESINNIVDFQTLVEQNTTNFNPNKTTKADWDFYEYMEYWLYNIIKPTIEPITFSGYKRQVTVRLKEYFTIPKNRKKVKEITADDLDEFYAYLRKKYNHKEATIDHYNDNISSAFEILLKKKVVRYNPTKLVNPIVIDVKEVPTYTKGDIKLLFDTLKGNKIELFAIFDAYYGLRRSEIVGLRDIVFDFENDTFIINHVCIQNDGKNNKEKFYFKDKTKSKKGYRIFPLFPFVKKKVLEQLDKIEQNKKIFGNTYNHKYDGYLFVHENGDMMQPNYFTDRFDKIITRNHLKKITPHGLRHSIATLLHMAGVDIRDLQDWLGHQNITSTNRYTRSDFKKQVSTGKVVLEIFEDTTVNEKDENDKPKRFIVKKKKVHIAV